MRQEDFFLKLFEGLSQGWLTTEQVKDSFHYYEECQRQDLPVDLEEYWSNNKNVQQNLLDAGLHEEPKADVAVQDSPDLMISSMATIEDASMVLDVVRQSLLLSDVPSSSQKLISQSVEPKTETPIKLNTQNSDGFQETLEATSSELEPKEERWRPVLAAEHRYVEGAKLGQGGLGIVREVEDLNLNRYVARKTLHVGTEATEATRQRFIEEARLTGQLEHPNIMPVYELGELSDGELYYTMRQLPSKDLSSVIYQETYTMVEMVKILQQVCMGLEYAHSRGVVHRDIKPSNIILGQFGEVLILDWGMAKISDQTSDLFSKRAVSPSTIAGIKGTPAYMAPEVVQNSEAVSPAADQYALGVVLYEILTQSLPFIVENIYSLLWIVVTQEPESPRQRAKASAQIPEELEHICLKMMAKDPADRYPSCRVVYERLEEFLEGTKERERLQRETQTRIHEAKQLVQEYRQHLKQTQSLKKAWEKAESESEPWDPLETKALAWALREQFEQSQQGEVRLFRAAITAYEQALKYEPENAIARAGLADLHWEKYLEYEARRDALQQLFYKEAVLSYDDGSYAALLEGKGELQLDTVPSGATVLLYQYNEEKSRLVPHFVRSLGQTPLNLQLQTGSYLLKIQKSGFQESYFPVVSQRGQTSESTVRLYSRDEIGEAFAYIPCGPFSYGGDPEAPMSLPPQTIELDDYCISRYPITFGEYLEFLNDIHAQDPHAAKALIPRSGEEVYVTLDETNSYKANRTTLLEGKMAQRYEAGQGHEDRIPVFGVSWLEAFQYTRWRSQREGCNVYLPTEEQWEKAASGVDRRTFPWGNLFEATFCKMGLSRPPEELQPEPVGIFTYDESPYGVNDMVGTISEWVWPSDHLQEEISLEEAKAISQGDMILRGGGWIAHRSEAMRIGARVPRVRGRRTYNAGFRIVRHPRKNVW